MLGWSVRREGGSAAAAGRDGHREHSEPINSTAYKSGWIY
jgi:hypothetical protein